MESEEESDDDSEYSEASEDSDSEGISLNPHIHYYIIALFHFSFYSSIYNAIFRLICFTEEELGSSEESGKDWSDLEREAAEEDKERSEDRFRDDYNSSKKKKSSRRQSPPSKDRCACIKADQTFSIDISDVTFITSSRFRHNSKHKNSTSSKSKSSSSKDKRSSDKHR